MVLINIIKNKARSKDLPDVIVRKPKQSFLRGV